MEREGWTPWIGIQDIFAYLGKRAIWGALVWVPFLAVTLYLQRPEVMGEPEAWISFLGAIGAGSVMAWRLSERHQWTGFVPYAITTVCIASFLCAVTLLAHALVPFENTRNLMLTLYWCALGALVRFPGPSRQAGIRPGWPPGEDITWR